MFAMFALVLLDPPSNLTLNKTAKPGQLKVTWLQPDFIDDFLLYEISYAVTGTHMGKVSDHESHELCGHTMHVQDLTGTQKRGWGAWGAHAHTHTIGL